MNGMQPGIAGTIFPDPKSLRHQWGEPILLQDQTERTCNLCGMVKITKHPPHGFPWREWRTKAGKIWQGTSTPPCFPAGEVKAS